MKYNSMKYDSYKLLQYGLMIVEVVFILHSDYNKELTL